MKIFYGSESVDTMDTISGYSGKSYEKIVQKKDPGNRENGVHSARTARSQDNELQTGKKREIKNDRNLGM
jgi:hypothetical protein